jgi:hypothetical protein
MRKLPLLPSFYAKSQVLEILKYEKHFKMSHNKESHKIEVLAWSYFSITGQSGRGEGEEKTLPVPKQEMGVETQNSGPHLLVLCWRAGEMHMVNDNVSGLLRWLLKQGGVILAHPKHRDNRCALELPIAGYDYSPPIQGCLQLVNISKRKAEGGSSSMSPCAYNLASKRRWEEARCSGSSAFTSLFQCQILDF